MFSIALVFLLLTVYSATLTECAKILGVFPCSSYSHVALGNRLMNELGARGHEVTFLTAIPQKETGPNLTQIPLTETNDKVEALKNMDLWSREKQNPFASAYMIEMSYGYNIVNTTLSNTKVQELLKSDANFDVIILENFNNEALYSLSYHFRAPVVLVAPAGPSYFTNRIVRNPSDSSYVSDLFLNLSPQMTFSERLFNTVFTLYRWFLYNVIIYKNQNELMHTYFPDAPELEELTHNTSLILLNSHVSTKSPVPLLPNMIEIGGFHIKPPKKLPKDLQEYLDSAIEGVIYFSMGSNLKSAKMPKQKRDLIVQVFAKLKQKILWKWEDEDMPDKPRNVKIQKWLPQTDILAHPNVKLFISHGGMLSTTEAAYFGVPILGIPIFGDQAMNIGNAEKHGYAISLQFKDLNESSLEDAIQQTLDNPSYAENAKTRSRIMHDQPMKALDKAMFWIEYVLRHNGAYHLRSAALDLRWYEYAMVDVVLFFVLESILLITVIYFICVKTCCVKKGKMDKKNN